MKPRTEQFQDLSRKALQDTSLRKAIRTANVSFQSSRHRAIDSLAEWETLRTYGSEAKGRAIDDLPTCLESFEEKFTARGGRVHWAETGADASAIVARLLKEKGARRIVKSKSMVTEEIGLNAALEADSFRVVETDFGEYIIQLAGETPSHIITPAIHKSRGDIAKLLHEKIGSAADADIPEMTAAARAALREEFLTADAGISGGNFLVADTGTLVIVENEGNARMTTTVPPLHIAVVGIEKVLPQLADLAPLLRLLCRSATGQSISSYVSFIGGPRSEVEPDGPTEVHVILLDAGRSALWADPEGRQALRCIRCGACLNFCPVYERIGGHAYGWVYPGPIGAVLTPQYVGLEQASDLPQASSLCGRCEEVCPVKIPLPDLLLKGRAQVVESTPRPWSEKLGMKVFATLVGSSFLWRLALFFGRLFYGRGGRAISWLPGPLKIWKRARELPRASGPSFRRRWSASGGFKGEGDER